MKERWRLIVDGYWVSDHGRVYAGARHVRCGAVDGTEHFRKKRARILGMNVSPAGYYRVNIYRRVVHVHTLVAEAFLGKAPASDSTVNHIDLDKKNNRATNLEWLSSSDNVLHAWANGAYQAEKAVRCLDDGREFESLKAAARAEGRAVGNLCTHLRGKQKTFAGKHWEYITGLTCSPWPQRNNA